MSAATATVTAIHPLVEVVRGLNSVIGKWQDDETPGMPWEVEEGIQAGCAVLTGTIPDASTQDIYNAGLLFAIQWQNIINGAGLDENGEPPQPFWDAWKTLYATLVVAEHPEVPDQRTVAEMIEELGEFPGKWEQVAKECAVFNQETNKYEGPFFNVHGGYDERLVRKEAKEPGSVLGDDWVHPTIARKREEAARIGLDRIKKIQAGFFTDDKSRIKDTTPVIDQLREGQFPDVIAKSSGVTEAEVRKTAADNDIEIIERDDILEQAAKNLERDDVNITVDEPVVNEIPEPRPPINEEPADLDDIEGMGGIEVGDDEELNLQKFEGEDLKAWVADHLTDNPEADTVSAMTALANEGKEVAPRSLGQLIARARKQND